MQQSGLGPLVAIPLSERFLRRFQGLDGTLIIPLGSSQTRYQ